MMQLSFDDPRRMEPESAAGLMADALAWIAANPGLWQLLVEWAYRDAARYERVYVKSYIEELRKSPMLNRPGNQPVKLKNALSAPFGRILRDSYPDIREYVPIRSSKCDGVVTG